MKRKIKNVILSLSISAIMLIPITAMARPIDVKDYYDYHKLHSKWVKFYTTTGAWAETQWPGAKVGTNVWWPQAKDWKRDGVIVERDHYSKTYYCEGPGSCLSQGYFVGIAHRRDK